MQGPCITARAKGGDKAVYFKGHCNHVLEIETY